MEEKRERSDTFLREPHHLEHAKKEKRESYCLLPYRPIRFRIHAVPMARQQQQQ